MTIFGKIMSKIDRIVDNIITTSSSAVQKKENNKSPNSVNATDIKEKNVDTIEIKNNTPAEQPQNNERTLGEIRTSLENLCRKNNIDGTKLMLSLSAITGKSLKEFNQLDPNIQKTLLSYVEESVSRIEQHAKDDVDMLEAVVTEAAFMYSAITRNGDGTYSPLESITAEQMEERRDEFEGSLRVKYNTERERIDKLPENEQAAEIEKLRNKHAKIRHNTFSHVMSKVKPEAALELMAILAAEDLGEGAQEFLESLSEEERIRIASEVHDFEHFKKCVQAAKERGEDITSEEALASFETYNAEFVAWKDSASALSYQFCANKAGNKEELPIEILKAAAKGIGIGAYANHVMTSADKEAFIKCWMQDNRNLLTDEEFNQVEQKAKEYIEEYLSKNPDGKCEPVRDGNTLAQEILKRSLKTNTENNNLTYTYNSGKKPSETNNDSESETKTLADNIQKQLNAGKSLAEICSKDRSAVNYILKNSRYSKKFLSDNNMIAMFRKDIENYINTYVTGTKDKVTFVKNNPKTLHIMVSCLDGNEKKEFADAMKGKISYTDFKATFKES